MPNTARTPLPSAALQPASTASVPYSQLKKQAEEMALERKFDNGHSTDDNEAPPSKKTSAAQAEREAPQPAPRTDEMQTDVEPCVAPLEQASATKTPAAEAPHTDTHYATASPKTSVDKVLEKMTKELEEAREMNKKSWSLTKTITSRD